MDYPFPTQLPYTAAQLKAQFGVVEDTLDSEPTLHYKLTIPLNWGQVKFARRPLSPQQPMQLRGMYRSLQKPLIEVKVTVVHIQHELSPSDWLSVHLEQTGEQIVHERHTKQEGGAVPDVLTLSGAVGAQNVSRWLVIKDWAKQGGAHLFVVQVTTDAQQYTKTVADQLFVVVSQFDVLHSTGWAYAERLRTLVRPEPVHFTTAFPESWQQLENPAGTKRLYQVQLTKQLNGALAGRIMLAIVSQQAEPDMKRLPSLFMGEYAKQGITFDSLNFRILPPFGGLAKAWYAHSSQVAKSGESPETVIEVMVGQIGTNWIYVEQHSPSRYTSPEAWAVSKRAFEIVLDRLRVL